MLKAVIYLLIVFAIGLANEQFMLSMRKLSSVQSSFSFCQIAHRHTTCNTSRYTETSG